MEKQVQKVVQEKRKAYLEAKIFKLVKEHKSILLRDLMEKVMSTLLFP